MITAVRTLSLAAIVSVSLSAFSATYIVPPDAEMIQKADDIVLATGLSASSQRTASGSIVTLYTLRITETLKGPRIPESHLVVTEPGGQAGGVAKIISGAPVYEPGERYLVFTSTNRDLEPVTLGMSLGQFHLVRSAGRETAIRQSIHGFDPNFEPFTERVRDAQRFTAWIRDTVAQRGTAADYFVTGVPRRPMESQGIETEGAAGAFSTSSYLMQMDGIGFRWQKPAVAWVHSGTQPGAGDGGAALSLAFSQWNATGSIRYTHVGADDAARGGLVTADGKNTILFNDPNDEIQNGNGVAGMGGVSDAPAQFSIGGETFWATAEADIVMANIHFSQSCLNAVMTHEVGHTLGFRHSNIPPSGMVCGTTADCTSNAAMNSSVNCATAGNLLAWDQNAAVRTYGGNGSDDAPARRRSARH